MNIETINARLAEIEAKITEKSNLIQQYQQLQAQANADLNVWLGSKYELQHWLAELSKPQLSTIEPDKIDEVA